MRQSALESQQADVLPSASKRCSCLMSSCQEPSENLFDGAEQARVEDR